MFKCSRNVKFNEKCLKFGKFWACRDECDGPVIAGESRARLPIHLPPRHAPHTRFQFGALDSTGSRRPRWLDCCDFAGALSCFSLLISCSSLAFLLPPPASPAAAQNTLISASQHFLHTYSWSLLFPFILNYVCSSKRMANKLKMHDPLRKARGRFPSAMLDWLMLKLNVKW